MTARALGVRLRLWGILLGALLAAACQSEPPPQVAAPTPDLITKRLWPEPRVDKGTNQTSAFGQILSAGGVGEGTWVMSADGAFAGHVGSPGEANVFRVWSVRQGSWARQVALPFAPTGPHAFSRDGRAVAFAMRGGRVWILAPSGAIDALPPGPCETPSHIMGIPEGGWVVVGAGGCAARFRAGAWIKGPDTGVSRALEVAPLTRGEPVIAGLSADARPAASIWWPDGVRGAARLPGDPDPDEDAPAASGAKPPAPGKGEVEAVPVQGAIIPLKIPASGKAPAWADISPTLVGSVYVAFDGVSLTGYDPAGGEPIGLPMPKAGPWDPLVGATVSQDSSTFYALKADGTLIGGPTALWEAGWRVTTPKGVAELGFMGVHGSLIVLGGDQLQFLDAGPWSTLPGPPALADRPWQPLELAFGNNGRALAVSYASPSVGGTSRWITLWGFEGTEPRRVGLGTLRHPGTWADFLKTGVPTSPVAGNPEGSRFAVQGPTGIQLFETSTGVRAGRVTVSDGMSMAFGAGTDSLLVAQTSGWILQFETEADGRQTESTLMELEAPPLLIERALTRYTLGVVYREEGGAVLEMRNPTKGSLLGKLEVTGTPRDLALSPRGDRALMAFPDRGLIQWPGGAAVAKAEGPDDRFTAVAYHPRTEEITFAGQDRSVYRRSPGGRAKAIGIAAGDVLNVAYHPLGRCVALTLGSGRVEIWGQEGRALAIEMWEGGRWTAWTPSGEAVGSKSLVEALRLLEPGEVSRPIIASTDAIPDAIRAACGG